MEHVRTQIDELIRWTDSADAIAAATSLLRRVGLPADHDHLDDVLAEVTFRITRRLDRLGPLEPKPGVVAYARTTMGTVVTDLLRGGADQLPLDTAVDLDGADGPAAVDGALADTLADTLDDLRHALHRMIDERPPWAVSAGLTFATLTVDPDLRLQPGTPQPTDGGPGPRAKWAGLHYAGRLDCFTDQTGPPDTACRNRRARALKALDQVLADAHTTLVDGPDGDVR